MAIPLLTPADAAAALAGQTVWAYRNLNAKGTTPIYSVRGRIDGRTRVLCHTPSIDLFDVEFRIHQSGRARALRDGHRNVHAYAIGQVATSADNDRWQPARYSLVDGRFHLLDGATLRRAAAARVDGSGLHVTVLPTLLDSPG